MDDENEKKIDNEVKTEEAKGTDGENRVLSPWAARFFDEVAVSDIKEEPKEAQESSDSSGENPPEEEKPSEEQGEVSEETVSEIPDEEEAEDGDKVKLNFLSLFLAFAVVIIVTVFVTFLVARGMYKKETKIYKSSSVCFDDKKLDADKVAKFQEILDFVRANYYKDYDINDMIEGAIEGMVSSLEDPYGGYYAPGNMDSYTSFVEGSYTGVGFSVSACEEGLLVTEVFEGSPAEKAGFVAGDVITRINGKAAAELSTEELSAILKVEGAAIKIKAVKADGSVLDAEVVAEKIIPQSVEYRELRSGIKYIEIKQFIKDTSKEFKAAVDKAAEAGAKGIIIDLRNNPGGYADEATAVADIILPEGTIATSRDRNDKILTEIKSDKNEITVPVVILVNQNSASASELVTGAFRDFKKGEIVGVHTYGKALSQINRVFDKDGSGIVLSYSRYFTPSGECIDGVGIEPTVKVELAEEYKNTMPLEIPEGQDLQLNKAIEIIEGGND